MEFANSPSLLVRFLLNKICLNGGLNIKLSSLIEDEAYCPTNPPNPGKITQSCNFNNSLIIGSILFISYYQK